jgi:hypothetical protein
MDHCLQRAAHNPAVMLVVGEGGQEGPGRGHTYASARAEARLIEQGAGHHGDKERSVFFPPRRVSRVFPRTEPYLANHLGFPQLCQSLASTRRASEQAMCVMCALWAGLMGR